MGLKNGGIATCWDFKDSDSGKYRDIQISTRSKNYKTGEYETDFAKWVRFIGDAAKASMNLTRGDRIKVIDFEVCVTYDKEQKKEYSNYKIWSFEPMTASDGSSRSSNKQSSSTHIEVEIDADPSDEEDLPF